MRIAMIAHTDAPWTPHYARYAQRVGHAVTVISFAPERLEGVKSVFVGHEPYRFDRGKHLFVTRVPAIRRILRSLRPDVVFAPYLISNGLTAALAWGGPLVVSARGADVLEQPGSFGAPRWILRRLMVFICRRARIVHTVSPHLTETLVSFGVPRDKIECFPVGVDVRRFTLRQGGDAGPVLDIVCTRAHEPVYENHVIVDALAALREQGGRFRCVFVGSGRLLADRRAQVKALNLEDAVIFVPRVDHDRMPTLLQDAQVYVSAASSDGTSSSLLEAMATGLLPVVARIPANEAWVKDGETGLLFTVGDHHELARSLARALADAPLRSLAREANRRLVGMMGDQESNNLHLMDLLARAALPMTPSSLRVAEPRHR